MCNFGPNWMAYLGYYRITHNRQPIYQGLYPWFLLNEYEIVVTGSVKISDQF